MPSSSTGLGTTSCHTVGCATTHTAFTEHPVVDIAAVTHGAVDTSYKGKSGYSISFAYDSSPVKNKYRTFDLPVDKLYKISGAWLWKGNKQLDFSLGSTLYLVGDADIDVTAQGVRAAGKFDKNYVLFLGGTARYTF